MRIRRWYDSSRMQRVAVRCNKLQHTAPRCDREHTHTGLETICVSHLWMSHVTRQLSVCCRVLQCVAVE